MDDARILIETDIAQARVISDALDLYSRLAMGQISEIGHLVSRGAIQVRDDRASDGRRPASHVETIIVSDLCTQIASAMGHRGGHFGIGRSGEASGTAYEIQKAVDKALADHSQPGGNTVRHDGVIVRYTSHPMPLARIVEHADS